MRRSDCQHYSPHGVTTEEAKRQGLTGAVKRHSKNDFMHHPDSSYDAPFTSQDMATVCKTGPTIAEGSTNALGSKVKSTSRVRATQINQSEGPSDIKGGQHLVRPGPHRGDQASSRFVSKSQSECFLHAPPCGLAPSRLGIPTRDYPGKTLETTWPGFDQGGGISPCLIPWRGVCPGWLSPLNGDPGSTQILTRHYGAQSQTVS
jgi:hypothetical protein